MKRDRVYLSKPDRLPFAPDQASALTRLMAVLESSFDGIFITDGQATPLWCNHSYEIISGLTAADVLGIPMAQLVATGVISHSSTLKALNQGQAVTLEQTFTTGKQAVVTSTPIYDQDDNVCLVVTNVRDISELTALQETLDHQRRLSAKYRQEMSVIRAQLMTTPQLVAEDPATLNLLRIVSWTPSSSSRARRAPARSASPPISTSAPPAPPKTSSASTAGPSRKTWLRASCLAMSAALSPGPTGRASPACLKWPTRAPSSWMR